MPSGRRGTVQEDCEAKGWTEDQMRTIIFMAEFYELSPSHIAALDIVPYGQDDSDKGVVRSLIERLHNSWKTDENRYGLVRSSVSTTSETEKRRKALKEKIGMIYNARKGFLPTKKRPGNQEAADRRTAILKEYAKQIKDDMNVKLSTSTTSDNAGEGSSKVISSASTTSDNARNGSSVVDELAVKGIENQKWDENQIRAVVFMTEFYKLSTREIGACGTVSYIGLNETEKERVSYLITRLHKCWKEGREPCKFELRSTSKHQTQVKEVIAITTRSLDGARRTKQREGNQDREIKLKEKLKKLEKRIIADMKGEKLPSDTSENIEASSREHSTHKKATPINAGANNQIAEASSREYNPFEKAVPISTWVKDHIAEASSRERSTRKQALPISALLNDPNTDSESRTARSGAPSTPKKRKSSQSRSRERHGAR